MIKEYGRSDNQCGLALDVAKYIDTKFEGVSVYVHDTGGIGINKYKCKQWEELVEVIKTNAGAEFVNWELNTIWLSGPQIVKKFDILIHSHYDLYNFFFSK